MKMFKKIIAVFLCISIAFSLCFTGAGATNGVQTVAVNSEEDLKNLEFDVPLIHVIGLEGEFYKGLSTETEDDDVRVWGFQTDVIVKVIFENIGALIWNLIIRDYDAIAKLLGTVANELFGPIACDTNRAPPTGTTGSTGTGAAGTVPSGGSTLAVCGRTL